MTNVHHAVFNYFVQRITKCKRLLLQLMFLLRHEPISMGTANSNKMRMETVINKYNVD